MGVDAGRFTPRKRTADDRAALIGTLGADRDTTVLLYAGRLAPEKNLALLVETMERLRGRNCHLVIAGEGIERRKMERRCRQERLPVSFLGHVPDAERLAILFANADIFLHPNPREPFGIAPLESMAAGLALVAPNSGGVTSYANDGNAWLTQPDGDSFSHQVRAICDHPELRTRKTACARETALQYHWPAVTRQFLSLYRDLHAASRDKYFSFTRPPRTYSTPGDAFGREIV
jgi:alpha-1,6-mannosyltransferase